jgi:phage terminase large subunit-like protein
MSSTSLSKKNKYYFDEESANRAVAFIETHIRHCKGDLAGQLFILEDWQKDDLIRPIFGWKHTKTNLRQYRTVYCEIGRKNGKSSLGAAIGLYLLFADSELGSEIFSCAGDRAQAGIIFDLAKRMILQDPILSSKAKVFRNSITFPQKGNTYKVLSSDASLQHGHNPNGILFDELHTQKSRELYDTMITGTGARTQPLLFTMTTAGSSKTDGNICWEVHDYAVKVKDGIINDETFLPLIYAADEGDDIQAPETWKKANPNLGVSISEEYLRNEAKRAAELPSYENTFKRLHLSMWTTSISKWISDSIWMENYEDIDLESLKGKKCWGGLDLASTMDLSSLALYFPMEDQKDVVLVFFWCPEDSAEIRGRKYKLPYDEWIANEYIKATPGNVQDYEYIRQDINTIIEDYDLQSIAFDRWNSSQLIIQLSQQDGVPMSQFGQGFKSMSAPSKELEKMVLKKEINHLNNPVLRWQCENIQLQTDPAGNIKINKQKSSEKVDGMIALVMAIGEMMTDETPGESIYNERGILSF